MIALIDDNVAILQQGVQLLRRLSSEQYNRKFPVCFNSSVGGHIRHNFDHTLNFVNGWPEGFVDYDARQRNPRVETDPEAAAQSIEACIDRLGVLKAHDLENPVRVKMDSGAAQESDCWSQSTVRRELQFLISHTVHHYALIATLCALMDVAVTSDFGVAPSTLRHQHSQVPSPAKQA
ncbi:MAG: DinB family protein [Opitutales bacterium]